VTASLPKIAGSSLAAVEGRVRDSLAGAQAEVKKRGRRLARSMAKRPVGCFLVAFVAGLAAARLLRRLD